MHEQRAGRGTWARGARNSVAGGAPVAWEWALPLNVIFPALALSSFSTLISGYCNINKVVGQPDQRTPARWKWAAGPREIARRLAHPDVLKIQGKNHRVVALGPQHRGVQNLGGHRKIRMGEASCWGIGGSVL